MKTLKELIHSVDSGWKLVQDWMKTAVNQYEVLPRNPRKADEELLRLQISTKSPIGAIVYQTGGILIDYGWLRILGSGSTKLNRGIMQWNKHKSFEREGEKGGFLLIADDVLGGYFAINAGSLGDEIGNVYYFAQDTLQWESLECGYSDFIHWALKGNIHQFYETFKWKTWKHDLKEVDGMQVFNFVPFLWTLEGKNIEKSNRKAVSVEENYHLTMDKAGE
ncbi:DUF2625 domain-containing protein [Sphingobacterium sp. SYP-B4668]|uniref:DUF2625 domain-containing protein n=1 Tax=Sphingobacterium sp. SYP-B4668 TaxID=2996035 RepID=UPI0022DE0EE2|nr:DUF2625 domain-containing protein [Sphingobacterium sp. SYP-B4668]